MNIRCIDFPAFTFVYVNLHSLLLGLMLPTDMPLQLPTPPLCGCEGWNNFVLWFSPNIVQNVKAQWRDYKKWCFCLSFMKELKLTGLDSTPQGQRRKYYDKRWGEGSSYTSVQFQRSLFSMHVCFAVYASETTEIYKDEEKMLWSKTACGKVFSPVSSVPITLLFCTHVCHPHTFAGAFRERVEQVP